MWIGPSDNFFFKPKTLIFGSFAVTKATTMHSILFESYVIAAIAFSLEKRLTVLLRYFSSMKEYSFQKCCTFDYELGNLNFSILRVLY